MGAKLKSPDMAIHSLCRSNSISRRWGWLSLTFSIVLSCCLLPLPSESASIQAGYVWNGDPEFANITGPTTDKRVSTTFLASSPNDHYALALTIETSKTSGPTCYLEVFYFYRTPFSDSAPATPPGSSTSFRTYPWTHPCPRTPLPNGNCTFAFTKDGDIQLRNSVAGRSVLIWSSNTTGLSATTLAVRDYDSVNYTYDGNLVLYNSSGSIVWANERNDSNYWCGDPAWGVSSTSHAAAAKKASVTSLMCLALISLGAALVLWDSGTARSGRDQLLIIGFVVCCLLLPSASESKPIQPGFTSTFRYNLTITSNENYTVNSEEISYNLVDSPANRTALTFHVATTKNWGPTCFLKVAADRQSTDIVLNGSAPGPAPSTNVNTVEYVPWSAPCPRKLIPTYGNCTFTFTMDGDIRVHSGDDLVWSSNTASLGATTLDVLDSDPSGSGSVVLYNNRSEVVWQNVRDMATRDFQCATPASGAALRPFFAFASSRLLLSVALLTFLALSDVKIVSIF